jgi:hypothetical protein
VYRTCGAEFPLGRVGALLSDFLLDGGPQFADQHGLRPRAEINGF